MVFVLVDFSENKNIQSIHRTYVRRIVIDPGHGGKDPGAVGKFSKEKDIVLEVSLMLGQMIERFCPDVEVFYTRTTDDFIELHRRAKIANDKNADLFLSIHCNASKRAEAHGFEFFVMGLDKSEKNLEVAKLENASILLEENYEQTYDGIDPNSSEAYIIFSLFQHAYLEQSLIFADKLMNAFQQYVQLHNRQIKQAPFLVLWRTTMPSVLVELAFISNPEEEKFLNSTEGKKKMAYALYYGFVLYKSFMEKSSLQPVDFKTVTGIEFKSLHVAQTNNQVQRVEQSGVEQQNSDNIDATQVYFAVQIFVDKEKLPPNHPKFKGIEGISFYIHENSYKYIYGKTQNYSEALANQKKMRDAGFRDAFVIALYNDTRMDIHTARKLLQQHEK